MKTMLLTALLVTAFAFAAPAVEARPLVPEVCEFHSGPTYVAASCGVFCVWVGSGVYGCTP